MIGGGDGTITLFDNACKDYAQTELRGGVVAMSFSPDRTEVWYVILAHHPSPIDSIYGSHGAWPFLFQHFFYRGGRASLCDRLEPSSEVSACHIRNHRVG